MPSKTWKINKRKSRENYIISRIAAHIAPLHKTAKMGGGGGRRFSSKKNLSIWGRKVREKERRMGDNNVREGKPQLWGKGERELISMSNAV